ncbi:MAG: hypothetical protein ACREBW_06305 [Candidatus Micrarchaeaceae archaeon]
MKQYWRVLKLLWRKYAGATAAGLLVASALLFRLGSLAPHLTYSEQLSLASDNGLREIFLVNPLSLPLKLLQWLTTFAPVDHAAFIGRLPGVLLGLIAFYIFIYISRRWYGLRSTLFGAVLFATSAWFLHVARFAGTDILYLTAVLSLLAVHVGLHDHRNRALMFYGWLVVNLVLLFVPGFVWLVAISALLQWRTLIAAWQHLGSLWNRLGWQILTLAGISGLVYTFIKHPALMRTWAGLPDHFAAWQAVLRHIGESFAALAYNAPVNPQLWVGHLPLLDIFVLGLIVLGILFYVRHWRAQRTLLLFTYLLASGILAGLGGTVSLSILMPVAYLIATAGTAYGLHFWLRMFPRNPVPRGIGIALAGCLVLVTVFYNLKLYYEVWPHSPDTQRIQSQQ